MHTPFLIQNMLSYTQERNLLAAGLLVMFSNLLPIISPFKWIGKLVLTIYRMLTGDVLKFLFLYVILLYGFATAMHVLVYDAAAENLEGLDVSPNEVNFHVLNANVIPGWCPLFVSSSDVKKLNMHSCMFLHQTKF
jgi:hypothetical protein